MHSPGPGKCCTSGFYPQSQLFNLCQQATATGAEKGAQALSPEAPPKDLLTPHTAKCRDMSQFHGTQETFQLQFSRSLWLLPWNTILSGGFCGLCSLS